MIDLGADPEAPIDDGTTPLWWAVWSGHEDLTEIMLERPVEVDARDSQGATLLWRALWNEYKGVARLLLQKGANPNIESIEGDTPLLFILRSGFENTYDISAMLLEAGANPNTADIFGDFPLLLGVREGQTRIVELLIRNGANPKAMPQNDESLVSIAEQRNYNEIVRILEKTRI